MPSSLTEQELAAVTMVLEYAGIEPTDFNIRRYFADEVLSITHDEHESYCWYLDEAGNELCVQVETLTEIDTSEFE